jgi:hypothetical protein
MIKVIDAERCSAFVGTVVLQIQACRAVGYP